jgi:hypothetical protein
LNVLGNSTYIKLVDASTTSQVSLQEVKEKFERYIDMTTKTGQQLGWDYADAAFPYTIVEKPEGKDQWFYLKGKDDRLYKYIVVGVGSELILDQEGEKQEQHFIQIVLPEGSTHGDNSKANEFCKYLAKEYKAQLQLFNGRVMYYYPRKP